MNRDSYLAATRKDHSFILITFKTGKQYLFYRDNELILYYEHIFLKKVHKGEIGIIKKIYYKNITSVKVF